MAYQSLLTLEKHFKNLADMEENSQRLFSLWNVLKKDLIERLSSSRSVFIHFSLHDATHSRKIITMIEMFLGEERISNLSPSDTFMLLCCAYAHDYGMALSADRVYQTLGDNEFLSFLKKQENTPIKDEKDSFQILIDLVEENRKQERNKYGSKTLREIYRAILLALQQYIRPLHNYGVISLEQDLGDFFHGRLDKRIINSILQICIIHGSDVNEIMKIEKYANGIESGIFHPRFIAAMLRLGDLLDLDNGRFPIWFNEAMDGDSDFLPESSKLHYLKHESVTHFFVDPKKIQVVFHCSGDTAGKVANLASHWIAMLKSECAFLTMHWSEITPSNFGRPPYLEMGDIYIKEENCSKYVLYSADDKKLQMQMPQDKILELLEGTNIYSDRYVGIRELIQNAVDASLIQMWYDLTHNKYAHIIKKQDINDKIDFTSIPPELFRFYDIKVELIRDLDEKEIFMVVKDKGTGIGDEDLESMTNIGQGKEQNKRLQKILSTMPKWMRPAGIFGIGLQSVFQLTDQIWFYTRQPNMPENKITFNSYGKNRGRIEKQEIHEHDVDGDVFYDNYTQGTNVKFPLKRDHLWKNRSEFQYYDCEFDKNDEFNAIYAEMAHVIDKKLMESPFDYFNIEFCTMTMKNGKTEKQVSHNRVYGFFRARERNKNDSYKYRLSAIPLYDNSAIRTENAILNISKPYAFYYDKKDCFFYRIKILSCIKLNEKDNKTYLQLPQKNGKTLRVWYKFSRINDISFLNDLHEEDPIFSSLIQMDVIIFDYPAKMYLNIDREHLKEQKNLTREKIEKIQQRIFSQMCSEILNKGRISTNFMFAISQLLLFKRYVSEKSYKEYVALLEKECGNLSHFILCFGKSTLPVTLINQNSNKLQIIEKLQYSLPFELNPLNSIENFTTSASLSNQIPSNYFQLCEIRTGCNDGNTYMLYSFNIRSRERLYKNSIKLDDGARFLDYYNAFDIFSDNNNINFQSLNKKLFKPDGKYETLIVYRAPKSFSAGNNFSNYMEQGIVGFILSPFDRDSASYLNQALLQKNCNAEVIFEKIKETKHFKKCVHYVKEFHIDSQKETTNASEDEEKIIGEEIEDLEIVNAYRKFVLDFCEVIEKNYQWIMENSKIRRR